MIKWSLAKEKKNIKKKIEREKKKKACNAESVLLIQEHVTLFEHVVER